MRTFLIVLGIALLALGTRAEPDGETGTVRIEDLNFEVSMPDSMDWTNEKVSEADDKRGFKVHFWTEFAGENSRCDVHVTVMKLTKGDAKRPLQKIAESWAAALETRLTQQRELKSVKSTLGGAESWSRDLKGELTATTGHLSWDVAKMGKFIYIFQVLRNNKAVGDDALEDEIKQIRDSFKFLKDVKVEVNKEAGKDEGPVIPGGGPDPKLLAKSELHESHWRLKMVKPKGLIQTPPASFSAAEKATNVIAKFSGSKEQTSMTIWVHAQIESAQRFTIEQEAESKVKHWEADPSYKARLKPEIDTNWKKKVSLAKDAIRVRLVGRRTVPDTTVWILAQCKNERQYQIRLYFAGATAEKDWTPQVKEFLKGFKPQKR